MLLIGNEAREYLSNNESITIVHWLDAKSVDCGVWSDTAYAAGQHSSHWLASGIMLERRRRKLDSLSASRILSSLTGRPSDGSGGFGQVWMLTPCCSSHGCVFVSGAAVCLLALGPLFCFQNRT